MTDALSSRRFVLKSAVCRTDRPQVTPARSAAGWTSATRGVMTRGV
jgi:hypothetical protein